MSSDSDVLDRTYFSRSAAARVLGVSPRQLRRWQAMVAEQTGPLAGATLYVPARTGTPWAKKPQYHVDQVRLIDRVQHEPRRLTECVETWTAIETALPELTLAAAEEMGLIGTGG